MRSITMFAILAALTGAMRTDADIADSPLPSALPQHVYSVTGVINFASTGTFFACTNVDRESITLGVELFGAAGTLLNDAAASSIAMAPGATAMLGTNPANGLAVDGNLAPGPITKGSARIVATSKKIVCTAFLADVLDSPPASMTHLTIIAKTKQKAAN
jgi:hypothetical protein